MRGCTNKLILSKFNKKRRQSYSIRYWYLQKNNVKERNYSRNIQYIKKNKKKTSKDKYNNIRRHEYQ